MMRYPDRPPDGRLHEGAMRPNPATNLAGRTAPQTTSHQVGDPGQRTPLRPERVHWERAVTLADEFAPAVERTLRRLGFAVLPIDGTDASDTSALQLAALPIIANRLELSGWTGVSVTYFPGPTDRYPGARGVWRIRATPGARR